MMQSFYNLQSNKLRDTIRSRALNVRVRVCVHVTLCSFYHVLTGSLTTPSRRYHQAATGHLTSIVIHCSGMPGKHS
jgi:hypothetical protein